MYAQDNFQFNLFLLSVGFGMILALLYDIFKSVQLFTDKSGKIIFAFDLIYSITATVLLFVFFLSTNYGRFRVYLLIGTALGFWCWFLTFSNFFTGLLSMLFGKLKLLFCFTAKLLSLPISMVIKPFRNNLAKISDKRQKYLVFLKNKLKIHLKCK